MNSKIIRIKGVSIKVVVLRCCLKNDDLCFCFCFIAIHIFPFIFFTFLLVYISVFVKATHRSPIGCILNDSFLFHKLLCVPPLLSLVSFFHTHTHLPIFSSSSYRLTEALFPRSHLFFFLLLIIVLTKLLSCAEGKIHPLFCYRFG
ncbi:unnamed protein product [Phytomonas sp. EM1]|nr:unnamed protein product [Phytomonas sp. EM1]|eukprot:CCW60421.1 unnamed protein product [Phytomonas sp. isolate EM1]